MNDAEAAHSMLEIARVSRGLTQAGLSEASGISQGVISKLESGRLEMDHGRRAALARALNVPAALFDATAVEPRLLHRLRPALPAKVVNRLLAEIALLHTRLPLLLGATAPTVNVPFRPYESHPTDRAYFLRAAWGMSSEPVLDLVRYIESAGVVCLKWDLSAVGVTALGSWPHDGRPVILLHETANPYALRFALAHELGHAVIRGGPSRTPEKDADTFAADFLMPRRRVREDLTNASLGQLAKLEAVWGVSATRLAHRARTVKAITGLRHRELMPALKSEPARIGDPHAFGEPALVGNAIRARMSAGERPDDIAFRALMSRRDLDEIYLTF